MRVASKRCALTGSIAAQSFFPIVPARLGMLYVDDIETAVRQLDLRKSVPRQKVFGGF